MKARITEVTKVYRESQNLIFCSLPPFFFYLSREQKWKICHSYCSANSTELCELGDWCDPGQSLACFGAVDLWPELSGPQVSICKMRGLVLWFLFFPSQGKAECMLYDQQVLDAYRTLISKWKSEDSSFQMTHHSSRCKVTSRFHSTKNDLDHLFSF